MLPLLWAARPTPHSNISNIYGNNERISTKLSEICLVTRVIGIRGENVLKYVTPFLDNLTPYSKTLYF